jgi:hypothetical protein
MCNTVLMFQQYLQMDYCDNCIININGCELQHVKKTNKQKINNDGHIKNKYKFS